MRECREVIFFFFFLIFFLEENMFDNKDKGTTEDSSIPADLKNLEGGIGKGDETDDEGGIGTIT